MTVTDNEPCCQTGECCPDRAGGVETFWTVGKVPSPGGPVPRIKKEWSVRDWLGAARVRLNIRRMDYAVPPGVYAAGNPDADSPVLLSANYKLSFDHLRRELDNLDAWILVLNTKGVNVWCAAGKGTFGTDEIVRRVQESDLSKFVNHRTLISPQLGAPGIAAHEVKNQTSWRVVYGPVRAEDLSDFINNGLKATPQMRKVRFGLLDRLVLIPMQIVQEKWLALGLCLSLFLLGGISGAGSFWENAVGSGSFPALAMLATYVLGAALVPGLLPFLPGRAFATKGAFTGILIGGGGVLAGATRGAAAPTAAMAGWVCLSASAVSWSGMNFTGSSTFTSLSGVKREMKIAVPLQALGVTTGMGLWITSLLA